LEDLTVSHAALDEWPLPPPLERFHAVVAGHARFHAAWWDDARLGVSVGAFADETGALDRQLAALPKDFAAFADRLGDRLSAAGVRGYSFETLWQDYRLSVLWQIITPMWQASHGLGAWIWWNHLECVMAAVHDLGCLELLD